MAWSWCIVCSQCIGLGYCQDRNCCVAQICLNISSGLLILPAVEIQAERMPKSFCWHFLDIFWGCDGWLAVAFWSCKSQGKMLENFGTEELKQGVRGRSIFSPSLYNSIVVVPGSRCAGKHRDYCYSRAGGGTVGIKSWSSHFLDLC